MLASKYNSLYRERRRNGQVLEIPTVDNLEEIEARLQREIKFLYKKLNPAASPKKLKQLNSILRKISHRI